MRGGRRRPAVHGARCGRCWSGSRSFYSTPPSFRYNLTIMVALGIDDYDTLMGVTSAYLLAGAVPCCSPDGWATIRAEARVPGRTGGCSPRPRSVWTRHVCRLTADRRPGGVRDRLGTAAADHGDDHSDLSAGPSRRRDEFPGATAASPPFVGPLAGEYWWTRWAGAGSSWSMFRSGWSVWSLRCAWCRAANASAPSSTSGGIVLSSAGMFLVVFGLQEGQANRWDRLDLGD